jgi:hypothetical protein
LSFERIISIDGRRVNASFHYHAYQPVIDSDICSHPWLPIIIVTKALFDQLCKDSWVNVWQCITVCRGNMGS